MLQADCDIAAAKDFERNFAGTYLGEHKTTLANMFRVIRLDFSGIDADIFTEGFVANVRDGLLEFSLRNNFKEGTELSQGHYRSRALLLTAFLFVCKQYFTDSIYLVVDEYDQGADEVLAMNIDFFRDLTRLGGGLKTFYSKIKNFSAKSTIARIFITGVTTIQLDSMVSGLSIAKNFTANAQFTNYVRFYGARTSQLDPSTRCLEAIRIIAGRSPDSHEGVVQRILLFPCNSLQIDGVLCSEKR